MTVRIFVVAGVAIAQLFRIALAQEESSLDQISNWTAPPFWSAPAKPAGDKEGLGTLDAEAADVVPSPPMPFVAINPCRIGDTRGLGFTGQAGPPALSVGVTRVFQIGGMVGGIPIQCGIPTTAQAVSFQFSVTGMNSAGNLIAWPEGPPPTTSVLNWNASSVAIGNGIVVPLGATGGVSVQLNGNAGAITHLIIDVNGYYAPVGIVNSVNGLSGAVTLAAGTNISITPAGQNLTIANTAPAAWRLTGNSGTIPGTNFVGTTDEEAFQIHVNGVRAMRYEPNGLSPNVIGGSPGNTVTFEAIGGTIGGGGAGGINANRVTDNYGTVAGGYANRAGDNAGTTSDRLYATVGGGWSNTASALAAVVAGGEGNVASDADATVCGGINNQATGDRAFVGGGILNVAGVGGATTVAGGHTNTAAGLGSAVGGGLSNLANGLAATVPGGRNNQATSSYTFAAGRKAHANNEGAFVWGDSTDALVTSTAVNQFIVRASGGIWLGTTSTPSLDIMTDFLNTSTGGHLTIGGAWTNSSDSERKENFEPVDKHDVLARVAALPISSWSYKAEDCSVRHIGPTGQDFAAAFGLGSDERSIATVDADGVALAAIQGLYEILQEKERRIEALEARLARLESK